MTPTQESENKRCRVLALDGGGIKGVFTAGVLAEFEADTRKSICDHFDLIAGTSTGGILAIGLGLGIPAADLLELYTKNGRSIFGEGTRLGRLRRRFRHAFGPKHDQVALRRVLTTRLGDSLLGHSRVRLVIPTFDALKGTACTFKTAHHPRTVHEYKMPAIEVALASAAAPTYFEGATLTSRPGDRYLDGGVWGNAPVIAAIVEAVHFLGFSLDQIDMLSVGTTEEQIDFIAQGKAGLLGWNKGLVEVMMAGQVSSALAQARLLLGERFHRVNFKANQGDFSLDDARASKLSKLGAIGRSVARASQHREVVRRRFLNGQPAPAFVPIETH